VQETPVTPDTSAQTAIGDDDDASDWRLRPELHAAALPPEAAGLKRVLERAEIKDIVDRFRVSDAAAVSAQARYKFVGRLGLYAGTSATLFGALFLLPIEAWLHGTVHPVVSAAQITALVVAFTASRWLAAAKPFDAWMKKRAEAEIARVELFDTIARAEEPVKSGELPLYPLKLEYFRRYQLDVQRRYYRGRGAEHDAAVWRNNMWLKASFIITGLSAVLGALAMLHVAAAWGLPLPAWIVERSSAIGGPEINRIILALGVAASGFYGLGIARSLMDLDERNASRFLTTADNLEFLSQKELPKAREAAIAGNSDEVLSFIGDVQKQISSEHQEWILLSARERDPKKLSKVRS
jgi:hypothetical protein